MAGGYYAALSGMRTRIDQLDRLADEIANAGTAGFKGERAALEKAPRRAFVDALDTAIDVAAGPRRLDTRQGTVLPTGRELDVAIEGRGFMAVQTDAGVRYTRNGHLSRQADGRLSTSDGAVVLGEDGPITVGPGPLEFGEDGTVRNGTIVAGKIRVVEFADPKALIREGGSVLRAPDGVTPVDADAPIVRSGALEQSNVSVVEKVAELTTVSRTFEALQRALAVLMNDVDGRTIDSLGRR
jgi:flagellar basal body rod protein FlgG